MSPVLVAWVDAHADANGWTEIAELETESRLIHTCGFLIPSAADRVTVALSLDGDRVDQVVHIPTECVRSVTPLAGS